jgi:hypothetical protein
MSPSWVSWYYGGVVRQRNDQISVLIKNLHFYPTNCNFLERTLALTDTVWDDGRKQVSVKLTRLYRLNNMCMGDIFYLSCCY